MKAGVSSRLWRCDLCLGNNVGHVRKVEAKEAPYEAGYKGKKEEA